MFGSEGEAVVAGGMLLRPPLLLVDVFDVCLVVSSCWLRMVSQVTPTLRTPAAGFCNF